MKMALQQLPHPASNLYRYGSWVYGTNHLDSDQDFIAVGSELGEVELSLKGQDFHGYTPERFQQALNEHKIWAIECFFLPEKDKLETIKFNFTLDLNLLRKEISSKSSNSWVKAKKKLEKEQQIYLGEKSLWHALRILDFGTQLARAGKISDYASLNSLYPLIIGAGKSWTQLENEFKVVYNAKHSEFKRLCPKE